ncbi:MAG: hypothetical protein ACOYL8_04775 [Patescibacteria group bacterium]
MKANEEKLDEICRKEAKVLATKEWLCALFVIAAIVNAVIYLNALSKAVNPLIGIEADQAAATTIIISFSVFAGLIIAGYVYNQALSKKLGRLWNIKKTLF